jgi:hypothetical protein
MSNPRRHRLLIPNKDEMAAAILAQRPASNTWTSAHAVEMTSAIFDLTIQKNATLPKSCEHGRC